MRFSIGKCQVKIQFSCFALLAFCCIFVGVNNGAVCFLAVLLHEFAHVIAMYCMHSPPEKLEFSALGCRIIYCKGTCISDYANAVISLSGPVINWLCFLFMLGMGQIGCFNDSFLMANLALGIIHSLPIEPLDGGLALRYLLQKKLGVVRAWHVSRVVSTVFLFPLAAMGFLVLLRTQYNYSLLALAVYIMLYLVLSLDYTQA